MSIGAVNWSDPSTWCAIVDLVTGDILRWQTMPGAVGYAKSALYDQVPILGRSLPILSYAHSSPLGMSISLQFVATGNKYTVSWVKEKVNWLESLAYPDYKGGITFPPHDIEVIVGTQFSMTGVVSNISVTYTPPWKYSEGKSMIAEVSLGITETQPNSGNKPYGWADIKGGVR